MTEWRLTFSVLSLRRLW